MLVDHLTFDGGHVALIEHMRTRELTMKKTMIAALVAVAAVGGSLLAAAPASAASRDFGYISCPAGSVFTRATANYDVTHTVFRDATVQKKTFPSTSATSRSTTFYSSLPVSTRSSITNPGTISSATANCAD